MPIKSFLLSIFLLSLSMHALCNARNIGFVKEGFHAEVYFSAKCRLERRSNTAWIQFMELMTERTSVKRVLLVLQLLLKNQTIQRLLPKVQVMIKIPSSLLVQFLGVCRTRTSIKSLGFNQIMLCLEHEHLLITDQSPSLNLMLCIYVHNFYPITKVSKKCTHLHLRIHENRPAYLHQLNAQTKLRGRPAALAKHGIS